MPRLLLVLALAFPLSASLVTGPERPVTAPTVGAAALDQVEGRIASNGNGFFVVFVNGANVDGVRVSSSLKRIDDVPLVIAGTSAYELSPDVAWGGDRYFVVWKSELGVRGRFVAPDGTLSETVTLFEGAGAEAPRVAFNGRVFLVVWNLGGNDRRVVGAIVDPSGTVRHHVTLAATPWMPKVAAAGDSFDVVMSAWGGGLTVTRVGASGEAGTTSVLSTDYTFHYEIASDGGGTIVAWNPGNVEPATPILAARMSSTGASDPFEIARGWLRALVQHGGGVDVVFKTDVESVRRIGTTSDVALTLNGVAGGASNGTTVALLTEDRPFDANLVVQTPGSADVELLTIAPSFQFFPEAASAGDTSLVVWSEWIAAERRYATRAARVDGTGAREAFELPAGGSGTRKVASNGSQWLVVWYEGLQVRGVRVSRAGKVLDPEPIVVAEGVPFGGIDVAWDGTSYVVGFLRGYASKFYVRTIVCAARVGEDGAVRSDVQISGESNNGNVSIAGGREQVLITWDEGSQGREVKGAIVSATGAIAPVVFPIGNPVGAAVVASNAGGYLVAAQFAGEVRWARVSDTGVVTEPPPTAAIRLPEPLQSLRVLELAPFGDRFILLVDGSASLIDPRGGATALTAFVPDRYARISGSHVVYSRAVEPAWENITRVFVRELALQVDPPRRRAVGR